MMNVKSPLSLKRGDRVEFRYRSWSGEERVFAGKVTLISEERVRIVRQKDWIVLRYSPKDGWLNAYPFMTAGRLYWKGSE